MKSLVPSLLLVSAMLLPSAAALSQSRRASTLVFKLPTPPVTDAPAGRRKGGASRGVCPAAVTTTLTALAPIQPLPQQVPGEEEIVAVGGLTVATEPTLWFYVPAGSQYRAEFGLQTLTEDPLYTLPIQLSAQDSVIGVRLPADPALLPLNTTRRWHFKIFCDLRKSPIFVEGWVHRRSLTYPIKQQLKARPRQAAATYAEHGLWYDALTAALESWADNRPKPAAALVSSPPAVTDWNSLLQSVGLEPLGTERLVRP